MIAALIAVGVFVLDLFVPLGVAGGVLYVAAVLVSLNSGNRRYTLLVAIACSVLTAIGFLASPEMGGTEPWKVYTNRALALFAIWAAAMFGFLRQPSETALRGSPEQLDRRFDERAIVVLTIVFCVGLAAGMWYLPHLSSKLVESTALQDAARYTELLREFRTLYTSEVTETLRGQGIVVTHDYDIQEGSIPLPATLSMMLGNRMAEGDTGSQTRLYSPYPFPGRRETGGLQDEFAKDAWAFLTRNPYKPFYRVEPFEGRSALRYATADLMQRSCVDCHNTHPHSPKNDWKVGDVRGVLEVILPTDYAVAATHTDIQGAFFMLTALGVSGLSGLGLLIVRLRRTSTELQQCVEQRTAALARTNTELETEVGERKQAEQLLRDSELRFQAMFNQTYGYIGLIHLDGTLIDVNQSPLDISGLKREDVIGLPFWETPWWKSSPEEQANTKLGIAEAAQGRLYRDETNYLTADGTKRIADRSFKPFRDESGRVVFVICEGHDITDRKRAEQLLRDSEAKCRGLLESAPDPIVTIDRDGRIVLINDRTEKVFGYTREELIGQPIEILVPERFRETHVGYRNDYFCSPAMRPMEQRTCLGLTGRRKDGSEFPAEISLSPMETAEGVLVTAAVRDVTERKQAEQLLRDSEERFHKIFEQSNDAILLVQPLQDEIVDVNSKACSMLEYSREELLSLGCSDLHPHETTKLMAFAQSVLEEDAGWTDELSCTTKTGRSVPAEISASVIKIAGKSYMLASVRDVTERKQAEEQLAQRQSEMARLSVLQALNDATVAVSSGRSFDDVLQIITDQARQVVGAHQAATTWPVETNGKQWINNSALSSKYAEYQHYDEKPDGAGIYRMVCELNKPFRMTQEELEVHPRWKGFGEKAEKHPPMRGWLAVPLIGVNGQNLGVLQLSDKYEGEFTQEDQAILTQFAQMAASTLELHQANEDLEQRVRERTEELVRSNQELEQFAYVASHDLQQPLRTVSGFCRLLQRHYTGKLDADADEFITFAMEGANRMQLLINDLLAYSRVQTRGKALEPTDCSGTLEQVIENLGAAIQESDALVTHDALPTVMADTGQLGQLFQNLIDNAIKFRDRRPPRVHVSAERSGQEWILSVRDNGIGIDPRYSDRIFTIFQRLHTPEEHPGTGIGLAICKKIVERHAGRIWMESQPGKGTTFCFTLPAAERNDYGKQGKQTTDAQELRETH